MSEIREVDDFLLDWLTYQQANKRAAAEYALPLAECRLCAGFFTLAHLARHEGICSSFCQGCGQPLDDLTVRRGVHPGCVSEVETRSGRDVLFVSLVRAS